MTEIPEPDAPYSAAEGLQHQADSSAVGALQGIDWNFPERTGHNDIEGIHPYPAKFVAELPRALLEHLPIPAGTVVLDPFCGSGTTLVESQSAGLSAIGIDLNPVACLISRVKTQPRPKQLYHHAVTAQKIARELEPDIPEIPNLDHWFKPAVQLELARLVAAITHVPREAGDCLRLAFSSIVVRVSNQESDTRYAAIEKNIDAHKVGDIFVRAAQRIDAALNTRPHVLHPARVLESNTLEVPPEQIQAPVGLVITSPPYPNAYEYWLYHKYRMWWLGFDPLSVKAQEIGARAHFFRKNHHTKEHFADQMTKTFALLEKVVVPQGFVCFVVGRSRIHGEIVDNAGIVERAGARSGFARSFMTERVLAPGRKSFNLAHANIKTETVLVLRKEGN